MMKQQLWKKVATLLPSLLFSFCTMAQTHDVTGVVTDEDQLPIPGVNVVIKGTTTGTVTGGDGAYSIKAADGDVLVFTYIGYTTEEIAVSGNSINVNLTPDLIGLSEVVVVGYGTQRKEAVTGSVASMKGDVVREMPGSNITQSLQGRIAGVNMQQSSTKPGAEMQIRVRGTRSLNASNDPLIVLDGVPFAGSLGDIDPNSIKSIDILKDASATAIYGSRGANGVILVTTTKGSIEQDAQIVYSGYYGVKTVFSKYPMMNAEKLQTLRDYKKTFSSSKMEIEDYAKGTDTDWQDELYDKGMVTSHDLSVTGGTKTAAYSFGFGYYREEAVLPLQNYSRFSQRAAIDQKVGKYIKVGFTSNNNYSITNGNSIGIYDAVAASPMVSPTDSAGNTRRLMDNNTVDQNIWMRTRETLEKIEADGDWEDKKTTYGTFNSLYAELAIPHIEGLKYRMNAGLNLKYSQTGIFTGVGVFNSDPNSLSNASLTKQLNLNWAIENLLTYDRTFGNHTINAVGLLSFERSQDHSTYVSASGIASKKFLYYNLGRINDEGSTSVDPSRQGYSESGLKSAMARLMYSYDDRYMLTVAVRNDKSSRLAKSRNSHTYPAVSVGWNLGRESFMEDFSWLNSLKFRVGYGQTSNQAVSPFKTLGLLATHPYNFGDNVSTGYYVSELANDELGWEYSETMNYGIDFGFLDRISGSFEYYVQNTNDVLLSVSLPSTSGVRSYMNNIGKTQNKGWEFNINATILDNFNGLTWEVGMNMYSNKNKLVELASGVERDEANCWFVGHSINAIYDHEKLGLWMPEDYYYKPEGDYDGKSYGEILEPGGTAGMIRVKYTGDFDENGMPTRAIGPEDRQIMDIDPKLNGGFNTRLEYKGFDFTVIGAFQAGGKLISTLYSANGYLNCLNGRKNNVDVEYFWAERDKKGILKDENGNYLVHNINAEYPDPAGPRDNDNPRHASTLGYFKASYCKIRTMTLGYNFKNDGIGWLDEIGIKKIRIYATVQNPWVIASEFKKKTGLDPETNSFGYENVASQTDTYKANTVLTVGTNTPTTRTYLVGLNITF